MSQYCHPRQVILFFPRETPNPRGSKAKQQLSWKPQSAPPRQEWMGRHQGRLLVPTASWPWVGKGGLTPPEGQGSALHARASPARGQQQVISCPCLFTSLSANRRHCFGTYQRNLWHGVLPMNLNKTQMSSFYWQRKSLEALRRCPRFCPGAVPQEDLSTLCPMRAETPNCSRHCPKWLLMAVSGLFTWYFHSGVALC